MSNYPSAPGGGYMPGPPMRPTPPPPVLNAVKLMYAGFVLSLLGIIIGLTSKSAIRTAVIKSGINLTPDQINAGVNIGLAVTVIVGIIGAALWLWMAMANKKGYSWARITATVFFGLDTLGLIFGFVRPGAPLSKVQGVLTWLVALGAVIFLWMKDSTAYFEAPK